MFKVLLLLLTIISVVQGRAWIFDLQIEENPNDNNNNANNNNNNIPHPQDLSSPPSLSCEKELQELCALDEKDVDEFDARMCLRAYRDLISDECSFFLMRHPSIVEPCYQEISTFCIGVEAGDRRILNCLLQQDYAGFSRECQLALKPEEEEDEGEEDTNNEEVEDEDLDSEPSGDVDLFPQQDDDDLLGLRDPLVESEILDRMFDEDDDYYYEEEEATDDEELDEIGSDETSFFKALIDELAVRIAHQVTQLEQVISQYVGAVQSRSESSKNDVVSVRVSGHLRGLTFDLQRASSNSVGTTPSTSNS